MTDKEQIITNGVDVSSCPMSEKCKEFENCKIQDILKQLTRKTQESERLKYDNDYQVGALERTIDNLNRECEELREKFKKFFGIDNQECWDIAFLKDEIAHYRKALEEIEKYINSQGIDNKWNMRIQRFRQGILKIINEVKGE